MSTVTYYCHDCEARRLVDWTDVASCIECGSTLLDQIPFVDEEEEEEEDDDDFSETEGFFFYQTNIEEDDEEERCLFEYLSSIYQQSHLDHEESIPLRQFIASLYHSVEDRREFSSNLVDMLTSSEDIIRSLNKVRLEISDPGVNEECSICQEIFGTMLDITVLPCKHRYHTECITRWLHLNTSCPICRYTLQRQESSLEQLNRDIDDLFAQDIPTSLEGSMFTSFSPYSSMDWRQQTQESHRTEDE